MADRVSSWSVGEVARLAGITVRTLHHYDRIGLLRPAIRSAAGYRGYDEGDLARLQRILAYRELGLGLDDIAQALDDPGDDAIGRLRERYRQVREQMERLARIAAVLERTMEAHAMGIRLTAEEMLEVFGEHDPTEYAPESRERWGDTDAYRQSARRTSAHTKQDWLRIRAEQAAVEQRLADVMTADRPADGPEAMDAAEQHRLLIERYFYDCPSAMHLGLAEMYLADPRFTQYYEQRSAGLARYLAAAMVANAARAR